MLAAAFLRAFAPETGLARALNGFQLFVARERGKAPKGAVSRYLHSRKSRWSRWLRRGLVLGCWVGKVVDRREGLCVGTLGREVP